MSYIPDAYDQWKAHDAEQQAELDRLPRCSECGEAIQDEYAYYINGEWIHEKCMNENYRKEVSDYVG